VRERKSIDVRVRRSGFTQPLGGRWMRYGRVGRGSVRVAGGDGDEGSFVEFYVSFVIDDSLHIWS
jgi:hypothetical protein